MNVLDAPQLVGMPPEPKYKLSDDARNVAQSCAFSKETILKNSDIKSRSDTDCSECLKLAGV